MNSNTSKSVSKSIFQGNNTVLHDLDQNSEIYEKRVINVGNLGIEAINGNYLFM
jgi:hypothetical protein